MSAVTRSIHQKIERPSMRAAGRCARSHRAGGSRRTTSLSVDRGSARILWKACSPFDPRPPRPVRSNSNFHSPRNELLAGGKHKLGEALLLRLCRGHTATLWIVAEADSALLETGRPGVHADCVQHREAQQLLVTVVSAEKDRAVDLLVDLVNGAVLVAVEVDNSGTMSFGFAWPATAEGPGGGW